MSALRILTAGLGTESRASLEAAVLPWGAPEHFDGPMDLLDHLRRGGVGLAVFNGDRADGVSAVAWVRRAGLSPAPPLVLVAEAGPSARLARHALSSTAADRILARPATAALWRAMLAPLLPALAEDPVALAEQVALAEAVAEMAGQEVVELRRAHAEAVRGRDAALASRAEAPPAETDALRAARVEVDAMRGALHAALGAAQAQSEESDARVAAAEARGGAPDA